MTIQNLYSYCTLGLTKGSGLGTRLHPPKQVNYCSVSGVRKPRMQKEFYVSSSPERHLRYKKEKDIVLWTLQNSENVLNVPSSRQAEQTILNKCYGELLRFQSASLYIFSLPRLIYSKRGFNKHFSVVILNCGRDL